MKQYKIIFKNIIDNTTNVATLSLTDKEYNNVVTQKDIFKDYILISIKELVVYQL